MVPRPLNIDYHIAFDTNYYSVPYNLVHELVEMRSTPTTVEILHKGQRVASHLRAAAAGKPSPMTSIAPRAIGASGMDTLAHGALGPTIGPHTARLFERIMADKPHPEMGYRVCLGIIRLAGKVLRARVEAAAERALAHRRVPLQERRIDPEELARRSCRHRQPPPSPPPPPHDNIRGAEYFE